MGEKQSSRFVADVAPSRGIDEEDRNPASAPSDGGGYGRQAMAHLAADGLERSTQPKGDPLAKPASGGADESWWNRAGHNGV